jgi:hypothetical protein
MALLRADTSTKYPFTGAVMAPLVKAFCEKPGGSAVKAVTSPL